MIWPRWFSVAALYALQKSMMLMPCGPSAVPTGGAGVAPPAGIWILTTAASFFFAIFDVLLLVIRSVRTGMPDRLIGFATAWRLGRTRVRPESRGRRCSPAP